MLNQGWATQSWEGHDTARFSFLPGRSETQLLCCCWFARLSHCAAQTLETLAELTRYRVVLGQLRLMSKWSFGVAKMQVSQSRCSFLHTGGSTTECLLFQTSHLWCYYLLPCYYGADAMIRHDIKDDKWALSYYKTKFKYHVLPVFCH